jgi:hypothetical protein
MLQYLIFLERKYLTIIIKKNNSPVALQLRYLQTLTHIAAEKNSTIVFPIPLEMLRSLPQGNNH